ncbi:MAG: long-chain fatty acid--CoA ligase [Chloroflexota bacterium]
METPKTIAHMQYERMTQNPDGDSYYVKKGEDWVPVSHQNALQGALEVAMGLWSLGVRHKDRIAVMSATRPEWEQIDNGALNMGAAVVSIYPNSTPETVAYILKNSGTKALFLENITHWQIVQQIAEPLPDLKQIILIDGAGMPEAKWVSIEALKTLGRELIAQQPSLPDEARDQVQPEDLASLMYTSGTTGLPKGVALTHQMLYTVAEIVADIAPQTEGDTNVIFMPMSHIMARVGVYTNRRIGTIGYFSPTIQDFLETCQAANPIHMSAAPRMLEKIHSRIMARLETAPPARKALFLRALDVGQRRARLELGKQTIPLGLKLQSNFFDRLVYSRIRTNLFGKNIQLLASGAAPLRRDLLEFFWGIGLPVYEGYGLTETSSPICLNTQEHFKPGTVGRPFPGSEVKIAEDGEILLKGPSVFNTYYNNPEATAASFTEDGWFKSGDIGELDEDGYLRITDRKKHLIITSAGKNIPPAPIEHKLNAHPLIGQVLVHGDQRKYLSALLTLDPDTAEVWAEQNGKSNLSTAELAAEPQLQKTIHEHVQAVNQALARFETIKRFTILPEEFSIENGYMTTSMKMKRKVIEKEFVDVLNQMYAEA